VFKKEAEDLAEVYAESDGEEGEDLATADAVAGGAAGATGVEATAPAP
jgi:hypothetical protein